MRIHLDEIIRWLHNNNMDNFQFFLLPRSAEAFIKLGLAYRKMRNVRNTFLISSSTIFNVDENQSIDLRIIFNKDWQFFKLCSVVCWVEILIEILKHGMGKSRIRKKKVIIETNPIHIQSTN